MSKALSVLIKFVDDFKKMSLVDLVKYFLMASLFLFTFFSINSSTFDRKVNLGGDNANYYILGKSIAQGKGYRAINLPSESLVNHFPPGYPTFISAVMKVSGSDSISVVKKANRVVFFISIILLFFLVTMVIKNEYLAFSSAILTLLNYHLLQYSTIMMSEILFFFLSIVCFLCINFYSTSDKFYKQKSFYLIVLFSTMLYYTRTQGIAIVFAFIAILLLKKQFMAAGSYLLSFVLLVLPWSIRSSSLGGNSYVKQLLLINPYRHELGSAGIVDILERVWLNFQRYICVEIPDVIFPFLATYKYDNTYDFSVQEWGFGLVLFGLLIWGICRLKTNRLAIASYVLANFGIFLLWPQVWFGVRFILPLVPIMLFLIFYALYDILRVIAIKVNVNKNIVYYSPLLFMLLSFNFLGEEETANKQTVAKLRATALNGYHQSFSDYFKQANWVNQNTEDTVIVCCRKPALFYLFANRKTVNYAKTLDVNKVFQSLDENSVDYVIYDRLGYSSTGRYLLPAIQGNDEKFKTVRSVGDSTKETVLLEYFPERGYSGGYKDGKRNGHGKCVYENGVYEGDWKDGQRVGEGQYRWNNGKVAYAGGWKSNRREGYGELMVDEKSTYKGMWKNDKKHGKGVEVFVDGGVLNSSWVNGVHRGYGEYRKGNVFYKGVWENYKLVKLKP